MRVKWGSWGGKIHYLFIYVREWPREGESTAFFHLVFFFVFKLRLFCFFYMMGGVRRWRLGAEETDFFYLALGRRVKP